MRYLYNTLPVILCLVLLTAAKAPATLTENDRQFLEAVKKGQDKEVKELLGKDVNLNGQDENGATALMNATEQNHVKIVRLLLKAEKIDPNVQNKHRETALLVAVKKNHQKVVQLLLKHPKTKTGIQDQNGWGPLTLAVINDHLAIVKALIKAKADVNDGRYDHSVLMYAADYGHLAIVKALIKAKADVNQQTGNANTALIMAARRGYTQIVKALIKANAHVNHCTDEKFHFKGQRHFRSSTALIEAVRGGHLKTV